MDYLTIYKPIYNKKVAKEGWGLEEARKKMGLNMEEYAKFLNGTMDVELGMYYVNKLFQ